MQLVRDSFTDQIYQIIKEKILLTEMRMGEQLNPRELAEEFRVSAMPVRDALRKLVGEGLVENRARVGFFVRSFTREQTAHIMEMRRLFELYCLETYFDRIDRGQVAAILGRCEGSPDLPRREFDRLDEGIHDLIIHASRNPYLVKSYHEVKNQIIICRHLDRDRIQVAHREHVALLRAVMDGDRGGAVDILRRHIERVAEAVATGEAPAAAATADLPPESPRLRARG